MPKENSIYTKTRHFLPNDLEVSSWEVVAPFAADLQSRSLPDPASVQQWLRDYSELEAAVFEYRAWCFIKMTCDTLDKEAAGKWQVLVSGLMPQFSVESDLLMRKLSASQGFQLLDSEEYGVLKRMVKNSIEIYRTENVPVFTEIQTISREYDNIASSLDIELEGEKFPIARAARFLEKQDRSLRELVWKKITARRLKEKARLDELFDQLVSLRTRVAQNAGFGSFTDYAFKLLGRFDYSREDCNRFHDSVEKVIRPLYEKIMARRKAQLQLEHLMPWDLVLDPAGEGPLNPFHSSSELISKTTTLLSGLDPEMGALMERLNHMGHLDLDARLGKAPGGYSYQLPETSVPFVFMNAAGSQHDLTTMIHEMGHAMHAWVSRDQWLFTHLSLPSEIAELASMGLELLSLDHWDIFYSSQKELARAKREQILRPLSLLPWIASIDLFQHWVYDHPGHSHEERDREWKKIYTRFHGDIVEWPDEISISSLWQKQGHLFDSPFYYIEYGIAQLGAISLWRNFRRDPAEAMKNYLAALSMGYSRPIPEIYSAAGIRFDFSEAYIRELSDFLEAEISIPEE